MSRPDFGLTDEILLPWYHEFARQYTSASRPYGSPWTGNTTLFRLYEHMAYLAGEVRFGSRPNDPPDDLSGFKSTIEL